MNATLNRQDLLFPELSYKIIGCAYDVFNQIGPGHLEKIYQSAMSKALKNADLKVKEQVCHDVNYNGEKVGRGFFDFLVEDKIIIELKRGKFYFSKELSQITEYLKMSKLELGIIIRFTPDGIRTKRVVNINSTSRSPASSIS